MAFSARIGSLLIRVIDVMTFNEDGQITTMKAYFGPDDMIEGGVVPDEHHSTR
jgi:hypothetical protein